MSREAIVRRDRLVTGVALVAILAIAWICVLTGVGTGMPAHVMTGIPGEPIDGDPEPWSAGDVAALFAMWWIMMIAMMLPSAAPVLLLAVALNRRAQPHCRPFGAAGGFAAGYLIAWAGFSALAVAIQWALAQTAALSTMMQASSATLAGALLIAAGLWQFAPWKHACLAQCRNPAEVLTRYRKPGLGGGIEAGIRHGAYCVGCCWLLMVLLFVGGVMNLYWIVGLAVYVLGEKLLPGGPWIGRIAGVALAACGAVLIV